MPHLQHNLSVSADGLRQYLEEVLPGSHLSVAPLDAEHEPLVLLKTNHIAAGFGFSNGDLGGSYDIAYKKFKSHYSDQHGNWDALDLAFVFCVQPSFPNLDQFCSAVETDVFFCRKFVVPISRSLDFSLARLPFLPLSPLEGRSLRPPSAQTFLQQSAVPALLARYIVVPRERGAEKIVDACIAGEFGDPKEIASPKAQRAIETQSQTGSVTLEEITVKNFRAYRKPQTFKLGADVTVLYGPNGFGKTSFFDAVDFAITGGIGRVGTKPEAHFAKMAQHLDAMSEESLVNAVFQSKGVSRRIIRDVKSRNSALLDGHSTDRKAILSELTGRDIPASDRVENFVNLFRATHLFNQELQELTRDFREECRLSKEIVSPMLALQDYSNALAKIDKITETLNGIVDSAEKDISELEQQIGDYAKEIERLNPKSDSNASSGSLEMQFEVLAGKLKSAGVEPSVATPAVATTRKWSSLIADALGESAGRSNRLGELVRELPLLNNAKKELLNVENQIREREATFSATDQKRVAGETALQELEKSFSALTSNVSLLQSQSALFEWFRLNHNTYSEAKKLQSQLNEQIAQLKPTIEKLRSDNENTAKELVDLTNQGKQDDETLKSRQANLGVLQEVLKELESWKVNLKSLIALSDSEVTLQRSLDTLRLEEKNIAETLAALNEGGSRQQRQVEEIDSSQSEFRSLLLQLQGHVESGTCPLCGEDHGTKDDLTERIQKQLKNDPASKPRAELSQIREKIKLSKDAAAANTQKLESVQLELVKARQTRQRLQAEIDRFANVAATAGPTLKTSTPAPEELVGAKIQPLQKEIDELRLQLAKSSEALEKARVNAGLANGAFTSAVAQEKALQDALKRADQEITRLATDPRWRLLSLEASQDQVASDEKAHTEQITSISENFKKAQSDLERKRAEVIELQKETNVSKNRLQALRTQAANHQRTIIQSTTRLTEAKLSPEVTEASVMDLIAKGTQIQENLTTLRNSVSNLELALDAATTAAALSTTQQNLRNKEKTRTQTIKRRDDHKPWLAYFASMAKLLTSQQNDAITNFTNDYGPRTSVIQRRLRSVYGFDDIEIRSSDSSIEVRVKRHGEELRPTDYFSQSQQQTLFLGLFLTACISQTWSGFSPIFMDDPVTHFDDLNIYAFLDLIVGLLESGSSKHQFIISTCDEKLLQLALQKFRHLGDHAVYYRFEAIGPDGPVINRMELP
jgi:exonuclease SbcC